MRLLKRRENIEKRKRKKAIANAAKNEMQIIRS
jgi:hypothetical protein